MKAIVTLLLFATTFSAIAEPPALPQGLAAPSSMPALPEGLSIPANTDQPVVSESALEDEEIEEYGISGFWDNRLGYRIHQNNLHAQRSISESRVHLEKNIQYDSLTLQTALDFLYDDHPDATRSLSLQRGDGFIDIRKLSLVFQASDAIDVRLGRQVLTWGTGDLLFLNDFFPKDWRYWIGRDIEYSKAPSDAIKISYYGSAFNIDLVYTPQFDPDRFIDGSRLSFYDNQSAEITGKADAIDVDIPDEWFDDDELAFRLYRNIADMELALYGYRGFYKSPSAFDVSLDRYQFSRLSAFGASLRKPLGVGIMSLETSYWDSLDDPDGSDPFIRNGETRVLAAYEWDAATRFTVGFQYYIEQMHDYEPYVKNLPDSAIRRDEILRLLTLRLSWRLFSEDLKLGLFVYHTPSQGDYYYRPEVNYRFNDEWSVEAGANLFDGGEEYHRWTQYKDNSNIFFAVRYHFGDAG